MRSPLSLGNYGRPRNGPVIQAIEDMGELDNTLIFYIFGDNGTSAEGVMNGLYNEMTYFNAEPKGSDIDFMLQHYDEWGGPTTYPHMAAGWAVAFHSPFSWTKQAASNYGGTRNPLVIHWPKWLKGKGELRSQWHHVIDVVPTILEAVGVPEPRIVNGTPYRPIEGVSMVYSWDEARAPSRHQIQYFEMLGNRGIYFDGWSLYVQEGTPTFMYNYLGIDRYTATANMKLPTGKSTVKMDFAYDGGKPGSGGIATLYIGGEAVGSAKVEKTEFAAFSADETAGVGVDAETPVSEDYDRASSKFTGTIDKVTINLK